jgi:leucyl-tRNA synthetase
LENFILLLSPFAPHIAEELWQILGKTKSLAYEPWPVYDKAKCIESIVEVVLQINGKIRSKISIPMNTQNVELEKLALEDTNVKRYIDGKRIIKKVIIPNKLVNIVIAEKS